MNINKQITLPGVVRSVSASAPAEDMTAAAAAQAQLADASGARSMNPDAMAVRAPGAARPPAPGPEQRNQEKLGGSGQPAPADPLEAAGLPAPGKPGAPSVNEGFDDDMAFNYGRVRILEGVQDDGVAFQNHPRRSAGAKVRSAALTALSAAVPVIGWSYLSSKCKIVGASDLGLARTWKGEVLLLPPGRCYSTTTVGTTVSTVNLANLTHFQVGPLSLVRVKPESIGLGTMGGAPVVLTPGLHVVESASFEFVRFDTVNAERIALGSLIILLVPADRIALVSQGGVPHFLGAGRHVINDGLTQFVRLEDALKPVINLGARWRFRVEAGQIVAIVVDGAPRFLQARTTPYCVFSNTVEYVGTFSTTDNYVHARTLHRIYVPKGQVGLCVQDGRGRIVEHTAEPIVIDCAQFEWCGMKDATAQYCNAGNLHRLVVRRGEIAKMLLHDSAEFIEGPAIRVIEDEVAVYKGTSLASDEYMSVGDAHRVLVPDGRVGLAWDGGRATMLESGVVHLLNSDSFTYEHSVDLALPVIRHGDKSVFQCSDVEHAVVFNDGELVIKTSGRHKLESATSYVAGFVPTSIRLLEFDSRSLTSDNVSLQYVAALSARVVDTRKAVLSLADLEGVDSEAGHDGPIKLDYRTIFNNVKAQSKLALSIVVANSHFASMSRAQRRRVHADVSYAGAMDSEAAAAAKATDALAATAGAAADQMDSADPNQDMSMLRQQLHDSFMEGFGRQLRENGVELLELSIEQLTVMNEELNKSLSAGAIARARLDQSRVELEEQRQTQMLTLELQREEQMQELELARERQAAELRLAQEKVEAELRMKSLQVDNDNAIRQKNADSQRAAAVTSAEGEAEGRRLLAKADAEAQRLMADAEAARLTSLNKAMEGAPDSVTQRELASVVMDGAAKALQSTNTSLVLAPSLQDATTYLYSGLFSEGNAMGRQLMQAASMPKDGQAWHADGKAPVAVTPGGVAGTSRATEPR